MDDFGPGIAPAVVAACQGAARRAAQACSRAFAAALSLSVGEMGAWSSNSPNILCGPGLIVLLPVEARAAVLLIPESCGLLPSWYSRPNAIQVGKLGTLAQELGKLLLPKDLKAKHCATAAVADLGVAVRRSRCPTGGGMLSLQLADASGQTGTALLLWPIQNPTDVFDPLLIAAKTVKDDTQGNSRRREVTQHQNPNWLRIEVPVSVTLATQRQSIAKLLEIVPGTILEFDRSCQDPLDLEVGGQRVARGECVTIGHRMALRITSLALSSERAQRLSAAG